MSMRLRSSDPKNDNGPKDSDRISATTRNSACGGFAASPVQLVMVLFVGLTLPSKNKLSLGQLASFSKEIQALKARSSYFSGPKLRGRALMHSPKSVARCSS